MKNIDLGIIGGGNMAEAILRGALAGGVLTADAVVVGEPSPQRRAVIESLGVRCNEDNAEAASAPALLLAVKPQVMAHVLRSIAPAVRGDARVISIAAGIGGGAIDSGLGGRGRIIRVMPNTPLLVGEGMSALSAGPRATVDDVAWVSRLFAASGRTCQVEERLMDAVTAVSGSGPAYVFYLVEAMIEAGLAEGLDRATAAELALQTCVGAAALLRESGQDAAVLRAKVTSPGGTTQRAIEMMNSAGVRAAMVSAIRGAAQRSRELGI